MYHGNGIIEHDCGCGGACDDCGGLAGMGLTSSETSPSVPWWQTLIQQAATVLTRRAPAGFPSPAGGTYPYPFPTSTPPYSTTQVPAQPAPYQQTTGTPSWLPWAAVAAVILLAGRK